MSASLAVLLVIVLVGYCSAQQRTALAEWTADEYPNPRTDPVLCGRSETSFVCDPNGLLTSKEADTLDWLLRGLYFNDTRCPCSDHTCETKKTGYVVAIAVLRKLRIVKDGAVTDSDKFSALRQFAYDLEKKKWRMGNCNEDIIIAYSAEDQMIYTMAGDVAIMKLNQDVITDITSQTKNYFKDNQHVYAGLRTMVMEYREALNGGFVFSKQVDQRPKGTAVTMSSTVMSILSLLFCAIVVL